VAFEARVEHAGWKVDRVSSWGMHWLEPLVEVNGVGRGKVTPDRVAEVNAGSANDLYIGHAPTYPWITGQ